MKSNLVFPLWYNDINSVTMVNKKARHIFETENKSLLNFPESHFVLMLNIVFIKEDTFDVKRNEM